MTIMVMDLEVILLIAMKRVFLQQQWWPLLKREKWRTPSTLGVR
jgi:hypothetical protein